MLPWKMNRKAIKRMDRIIKKPFKILLLLKILNRFILTEGRGYYSVIILFIGKSG